MQARTVADDSPVGSFTAVDPLTRLSSCPRPDVCTQFSVCVMDIIIMVNSYILFHSLPLLTTAEHKRQVLSCRSQPHQLALDLFASGECLQSLLQEKHTVTLHTSNEQ